MKRKLFSVTIVLMLLFQLIPFSTVLASDGRNIGALEGWVNIHGTDGDKPSLLVITGPDGQEYEPVDGVYNDIPAGAKIELTYAFSLSDGSESTMFEYEEGDYFIIELPKGLEFNSYTKTIKNENTDTDLAVCTISETRLTVALTEDAASEEQKNKWGYITIEGTFLSLEQGDGNEETRVIFGEEEIVIKRVPLPVESTLTKSGSYDPVENEIEWTVIIEVPKGDKDLSYKGYTVIDSYSDNQEYIQGTFKIDDKTIDDGSLIISESAISYTFSEETEGDQTISYKTKPIDFSGSDGKSIFENTAVLKLGENDASDPVTAGVEHDWIVKSGKVSDGAIVKWTITVKIPEGEDILPDAKIVDKINNNFKLLENEDYPVTVRFDGEEHQVGESETAGAFICDGNDFTYTFPDGKPECGSTVSLSLYTEAKDKNEFLDDNEGIDFENTAYLIWGETEELEKFPSVTCSIKSGIGGGGLLSKVSTGIEDYRYVEKDIIKWTIIVNRNEIKMESAVIEDKIPLGQELLIEGDYPFTVSGKGIEIRSITTKESSDEFTYIAISDNSHEGFEYELKDISSIHEIVYYTKITDHNSLYKNGNVHFYNEVILNYDGKTTGDVPGTKTYSSRMLEKSIPIAYDYNTHLIKWKLTVNRNRLPLNNAVVSDNLPDGMMLYIDKDHPFEISPSAITSNTAIHGKESFEIELPENTNGQYTIEFWSKLNDNALQEQWAGKRDFKNEAVLESDECEVTGSAVAKIENPVVFKDYTYTAGKDVVSWSVIVNNAQMNLEDATVTDELDSVLQLVEDSVTLYKVPINASTGKAEIDDKELVTEGHTIELDEENKLTIGIPDGPFAYLIEFSTIILNDSINLKNKVVFEGKEGSPEGDSESRVIKVDNLYSGGGSGSEKFTVYKYTNKGEEEIPLSGVTFRLLNANKDPITKGGNMIEETTDDSGKALFENLPSWTFLIEEISTARGYLTSSEPYFVGRPQNADTIIEIENKTAVIDIPFRKVDKDDKPLSGGKFQLAGKAFNGEDIIAAANSEEGIVTFKNIPIDNGEGYTISELAPPPKYRKTDDKLKVFVNYIGDDQFEIEYLFDGDDVLSNVRAPSGINYAKILVYKTDEGKAGLYGAEFTLYDSKGEAVATAISDKDGVAEFDNIPAGDYFVAETLAPSGYVADENGKRLTLRPGQTMSVTFINKIDEEDVVEPEKPDDGEDIPDSSVPEGSAPGGIISDGHATPKTGDDSLLFFWFITVFAALLAAHFLIRDISFGKTQTK